MITLEWRYNKYQLYSLWFDPNRLRTYDIALDNQHGHQFITDWVDAKDIGIIFKYQAFN